MTTYNATVTNGIATIPVDTTNMNEGEYSILANYNQNEHYNSSTANATLTIEPAEVWHEADISTTSTEWNTTPQSDGVHATSSYVAYNTKIPPGNTLEITLNISGGVILDLKDRTSSNSASLAFKNNEITKWGTVGSGKVNNDGIPTGNSVVVQITNTGTGTFAYQYSDGTSGIVTLSNGNLDSYYLTFNNNNSGEVVITRMRYKTNN